MTSTKTKEGEIVNAPNRKRKSPLFWISLIGCGCILLLCCICSAIPAFFVMNEDYKDSFKEAYCDSWKEQGGDTDKDPFGWCK